MIVHVVLCSIAQKATLLWLIQLQYEMEDESSALHNSAVTTVQTQSYFCFTIPVYCVLLHLVLLFSKHGAVKFTLVK